MCKEDAAVRLANDLMRSRLAVGSKEETGVRGDVGVAPAIEHDAGNIAPCIESCGSEHFRHLFAQLPFILSVARGQELGSSGHALCRGIDIGLQYGNVESQNERTVWSQGR